MSHVITELSPVVAHALRFTAVLEKLQATPYHQKTLDEIFASPWPMSSLFGASLFLVVYETNFATEIDSVKPISQMTSQNNPSLNISYGLSVWSENEIKSREIFGSSEGIFCTIFHPYISLYHKIYDNIILNINKNRTLGALGNIFQNIIRKNIDAIQQKVVGIWKLSNIPNHR